MKRIAVLLIISVLLCGCTREGSGTHFAMDTVMTFSVWGGDWEEALDGCVETVNALEADFSVTRPDSILSRINAGERVELPEEYEELMERVLAISQQTHGAFDPRMRRLSQAWGFYDEEHHVPGEDVIRQAVSQPEWDLGGALKGYAGDVLCAVLAENGVRRGILSLGGNIQTFGEKPDGTPWRIGIQNPEGGADLGLLSVTGTKAVVTSGDYQRFFEEDGIRYHHILDPETGYPADSGLRSVTVISESGLKADCLSTALFVMGLEEGTAFWREWGDFEAVFVTTEGKIYATEGASLEGCEYEVICR